MKLRELGDAKELKLGNLRPERQREEKPMERLYENNDFRKKKFWIENINYKEKIA